MRHRGKRAGHRSKRQRRWIVLSGLAALAVVVAASLSAPGLTQRLRYIAFDAYQQIAPRPQATNAVVVIDIDEASIEQIGQWPWPRTTIVDLVDRLGSLGASAIGFDIVFGEADRTSPRLAIQRLEAAGVRVDPAGASELELDNDAVLARAFGDNPVVAGLILGGNAAGRLPPAKAGFAFGGADPRTYLPAREGGVANLPPLDAAAAGIGVLSFPIQEDGIVRSLPVVTLADDALYASLATETLRVAQGAGSYVVRSTGASGEIGSGRAAMIAMRNGALTIPTGPQGQFRIHYSGLPDLATIPAATILQNDRPDPALARLIEGRIVLVGTSAAGLRDLVSTPLQSSLPGVYVHAEMINQILSGAFLTRPDWAPGAETVAAVAVGIGAALVVASGIGALWSAIAVAGLALASAAVSWVAFTRFETLLDPIVPGLAAALVFAAAFPVRLATADREKRFVREAFSRYLAPDLVERLADRPGALTLGGEVRDLTVLFSDVRGFSALSETLSPEEVTTLLNELLTPTTDRLLAAGATIDKYIGDAIMAFWNAPLDIADHPRKACLAALQMLDVVDDLNRRTGRGLALGIGLHTGECCVGNLGSDQRFSYSAIGDDVNVAARVEGLTKQYGVPILVTEATAARAGDLAFIEADRVRVVGRAQPVTIHVLVGDADVAAEPSYAELAKRHAAFIAAYREADFVRAATPLSEVKAVAPEWLGRFYEIYAERIAGFAAVPPAPGWDGVYEPTSK